MSFQSSLPEEDTSVFPILVIPLDTFQFVYILLTTQGPELSRITLI